MKGLEGFCGAQKFERPGRFLWSPEEFERPGRFLWSPEEFDRLLWNPESFCAGFYGAQKRSKGLAGFCGVWRS